MNRSQAILAIGVIAAVAGAGFGLSVWNERAAEDAAIEKLASAARTELARDDLDRERVGELLRQLKGHQRIELDARLIVARASLEFALDRVQAAWDAIAALVFDLEAEISPEAMLLAARIKARMHVLRGETKLAADAMAHAEQHYNATNEPASLFLAWQSARRAAQDEDRAGFADLFADHPGTPEAALVAALESDSTTADQLRALEIRFGEVPEELHVGVAYLLINPLMEGGDTKADDADAAVAEALVRLEQVRRSYPSYMDARILSAAAFHLAGEREKRDRHLDWLLANAPDDDDRRQQWRKLRDAPAGRGP